MKKQVITERKRSTWCVGVGGEGLAIEHSTVFDSKDVRCPLKDDDAK
jgi:hypothetical protein